MKGYLSDGIRVLRPINATAAGTTDINGTGVDMTLDGGYDGVLFIALYGTLTATQVTKLKAEHSADDSTYGAITGAACTALGDSDGNGVQMLDVYKPQKQYVRPVIDRGTANAVVDGVIAILYKGRTPPAANHAVVKSLIQVAEA
jgi:hypothetical protein